MSLYMFDIYNTRSNFKYISVHAGESILLDIMQQKTMDEYFNSMTTGLWILHTFEQ